MSRVIVRSLLTVLLLAVVAGCATRSGPSRAGDGSATLAVTNQAWLQMRIYAVVGGQRIRLGEVGASQSATLRIPSSAVGGGRDLSFIADALAGGQATSFSIYVRPGDEVRITIPPSVR